MQHKPEHDQLGVRHSACARGLGTDWVVTNAPAGQQKFYRLLKP